MRSITVIWMLTIALLILCGDVVGQDFDISKYILGMPKPRLNVSLTDSVAFMRFGDTLHIKLILRNCDTVPVFTLESGPRIDLRRIPQRQCEASGPDFTLVKQEFQQAAAEPGQPPKVKINPGEMVTIAADFVCPDCFLKYWIGDYTACIDIYCESIYGKEAEWVHSDNSVAVLVIPSREN